MRSREKEGGEEGGRRRGTRGADVTFAFPLPHNHLFTTDCSRIVLAVAVVAEVSSFLVPPSERMPKPLEKPRIALSSRALAKYSES